METPELSQSQKSKSLTGNKSKQKKKKATNIRNIFMKSGTRKCFKLSEDDSIVFEEKLSKIFKFSTPPKPKWNEIKAMSKEKRAAFKQKFKRSKSPEMSNIIFGINAVTRAVETKTCTLVLLSNDIIPDIMIKHIVVACNTYQIPAIEIPNLRKTTKKCFGFSAIAVAFKKISNKSPLKAIKDFFISVIPEIEHMKVVKNIQYEVNIKEIVKESDNFVKKQKDEPIISTSKIYLERKSTKERCFIPPKSDCIRRKTDDSLLNMDFIAFDDGDITDSSVVEVSPETKTYKNLKIKRLKPNPDRKKGKKKK